MNHIESGSLHKYVSPRNLINIIHRVSATWFPKQEMNKGNSNKHTNVIRASKEGQ